jgi:hypothetical protein
LPSPLQASSFQPFANLWLNVELFGETMTKSVTFEMEKSSKATTLARMDAVQVSNFAFTCFEIWTQSQLPILEEIAQTTTICCLRCAKHHLYMFVAENTTF